MTVQAEPASCLHTAVRVVRCAKPPRLGMLARMKHRLWLVALPCMLSCRPPLEPASETSVHADPPSQAAPLPVEETPTASEAEPAAQTAAAQPDEQPGIMRTSASTRGTLPQAVISEKLASIGTAIRACYEAALQENSELRGPLSVSFVIAPDGKVAHAQAASDSEALRESSATRCILEEIRKLEFPEPKGGRVFVDYPLKLEPQSARLP